MVKGIKLGTIVIVPVDRLFDFLNHFPLAVIIRVPKGKFVHFPYGQHPTIHRKAEEVIFIMNHKVLLYKKLLGS